MDKKTNLKREWYKKMRGMGIRNVHRLDSTWALLDRLGMVDDVVDKPPDMAVENLLIDAETCLEYADESQSQLSVPRSNRGKKEEGQKDAEEEDESEELHFQLSDLQRERAAVFEEYVAGIAANDFRVRGYRGRVLGGELLTPEQALALIHSPAAWVFSPRQFSNWDIPVVGHFAQLKDTEEYRAGGRFGNTITVHVEPPGIERTKKRILRKLPFVNESGYAESITVGEGSVLGDLAELADKLHATYPWESKADIVHFVLTGAIPTVPPVRMYFRQKSRRKSEPGSELSPGGFRYATITLEVAPWISAETVKAAFFDAKKQIFGKRRYRRLEEKSLKMIRFVAGYDKPPKGRRLLEAWNATKWVEKNPAWYYNSDNRGESSRFWRDYHRARRALAYGKRPRRDDN